MKKLICFSLSLMMIFSMVTTTVKASAIESSGNITEDTTWNDTTSTYTLNSDIRVKYGAILNIAKGVTVNGNGHAIYVYGTLNTDCATISNTIIGAANTNNEACTINIENSSMTEGSFLYENDPSSGSTHTKLTLKNNVFKNLDGYIYIWYPTNVVYIEGNVFDQCGGLSIGSQNDVYITNNAFHGMTTPYAIEDWAQYSSNCYVSKNSFYDTGTVLKLKYSSGKMTAKGNFWNTSSTDDIQSRISDANTNYSISETIDYSPYLSEPDSQTPAVSHTYKLTSTKLPTCNDTGEKVYTCSVCSDVKVEILPIDPTNHAYANPEFNWSADGKSCTVTYTCANDSSHKAKYDCTVTSKVKTAPTCTVKGTTTYTATYGTDTDTKDVQDIDLVAHIEKSKVTAATTSADGKIVKYCSVCNEILSTTTIKKIRSATLKYSSITYTGSALKPAVIVKDSAGKTINSSNYAVSYNGNKNVGTATVTIKFKGNYSGTLTETFKINPKSTEISKLTATSKGFKMTWKKQSQTTGYQTQYATDKNFTKNKGTVTVNTNGTTSKSFSKLKGNTKYYIRIRTYKTVNKTKYYSNWVVYSKSVKTKNC